MKFERASNYVERRLNEAGQSLNELQKVAMKAAWDDITYQEICRQNPDINFNTLRAYVSVRLWRSLSEILNQPVTKKNFRKVLTAVIEEDRQKTKPTPDTSIDHELQVLGIRLPETESFYGRKQELQELSRLVQKYSGIILVGVQGIGKKSLVSKFIQSEPLPFSTVIWKPLHHQPSVDELEAEILALLGQEAASQPLISILQKEKCLLVLDGLDALIKRQGTIRTLDPGYVSLIRRIVEETDSKIVVTSREPIEQLTPLFLRGDVATYTLRGLTAEEAALLFDESFEGNVEKICRSVGGNPWILKGIADWSRSVGSIEPQLVNRLTVQRGIVGNLYEQVLMGAHLSTLDRTLLLKVAKHESSMSFSELLSNYPESAQGISRLVAMGLASQNTSDSGKSMIELDDLFKQYLIKNEPMLIASTQA
ncbi:MAG: hypothetical protein AAF329_01280 [Cyanobacteria bacterium P01_A01_bin.17]